MPTGKGSKLLRYVEHRLRVTLHDGRYIIGTFLAFDKHMNLVLSESEEYRFIKKSSTDRSAIIEERTEKRILGLVLIRGENVISLAVEGPPPPSADKASTTSTGPGIARGAGRGVVAPPPMQQQQQHGMVPPPGQYGAVPPMGLGAAPVYGVGGGLPPPPPPPPPPPGGVGGLPPPGMGRGMPYPPQY